MLPALKESRGWLFQAYKFLPALMATQEEYWTHPNTTSKLAINSAGCICISAQVNRIKYRLLEGASIIKSPQ